jgi:hypothetical protein
MLDLERPIAISHPPEKAVSAAEVSLCVSGSPPIPKETVATRAAFRAVGRSCSINVGVLFFYPLRVIRSVARIPAIPSTTQEKRATNKAGIFAQECT